MKKERILKLINEAVHKLEPNARIILYGSRARGDSSKYSDWDLLILTENQLQFEAVKKIRDTLYEIELEMDVILSSIVRSRQEWESDVMASIPFKLEIERDGIAI